MKLSAVNIFNNIILSFSRYQIAIQKSFTITFCFLLVSCNSGGGVTQPITDIVSSQYYQVPVVFQCVNGCNNLFSENNPLNITVTSKLPYVYINKIAESKVQTIYTSSSPYAPVYYILYDKNMAAYLNNNPTLVVAQIHYEDAFGDEKYIPLTISDAINQYGANATTNINNWSGASPYMNLVAAISGTTLLLNNSLMVPGGTYLQSCQFVGLSESSGIVRAKCSGSNDEISSLNPGIICSSTDSNVINLNGTLACEKYSSSNVLSIVGLQNILGEKNSSCSITNFLQNDETDITTMTGYCFNNLTVPIAYMLKFQSTVGANQYGSPCSVGDTLKILDSNESAPYPACVADS